MTNLSSINIFTNLIIIIMWIVINYLIKYMKDTNRVITIAFFIWVILSIIFYSVSNRYLPM